MERSPFLPLPEGMVIGQVEITQTQLTVEVISTQPCARCPGCGTPPDAVHCQYQRTVHDVPCGGRKVVLRLKVLEFLDVTADTLTTDHFAEFVRPRIARWDVDLETGVLRVSLRSQEPRQRPRAPRAPASS